MLIKDIINAIETLAPLSLQEEWDNSGVQVGSINAECRGVMLCVDCTPAIVDEATEMGCNLIVSHHPVIFKGLKRLTGSTPAEQVVMKAIREGITIYSSHTALDSASEGVSRRMAAMLGLEDVEVLSPQSSPDTGLGCVGNLPTALSARDIALRAKHVFGCQNVRISSAALVGTSEEPELIKRVALCGGAGGSLIGAAIAAKAGIYVTADLRYHDFVDYSERLKLVDIGHFDSEYCSTQIFYQLITEKFPNFAVNIAKKEKNPIQYL